MAADRNEPALRPAITILPVVTTHAQFPADAARLRWETLAAHMAAFDKTR